MKNLLENSSIRIAGIYCDNINLKFDFDRTQKLAPGERVDIPVEGFYTKA